MTLFKNSPVSKRVRTLEKDLTHRKNILIVVDTLLTGGAEIFALRLGKALKERYNVFLFCKHYNKIDLELVNCHFPKARIFTNDGFFLGLFNKIDSLFFRLSLDVSLFEFCIQRYLYKLILDNSIDVIHSHLSTVDFLISKVVSKVNFSRNKEVKHVLTVHGDYLKNEQKVLAKGRVYKFLNFHKKLRKLLLNKPEIVCISEKQLDFFTRHSEKLQTDIRLTKIYNGYEETVVNIEQVLQNREKCKIHSNDKVFGMVSRGIPEKGWELVLKAFIKILDTQSNTHLILVGDSPYLRELEIKYKSFQNIHFVGHSANPIEWIKLFDVGLLLSYYKSESLPTVIVEYLSCNVPVLAAEIGEIKKMLTTHNSSLAGAVVKVDPDDFNIEIVLAEMFLFLNDKNYMQEMKKNTQAAFSKFNMKDCVNRYSEVYN